MSYKTSEVTSYEFIWTHGKDAPRIITSMMDREIEMHHSDEALKLDRIRREVVRLLRC